MIPFFEAEIRVVADQREEARIGRCVGEQQPAVERQRAVRKPPLPGDLAHVERHGADLAARAAQVARHALRRRASAQAVGVKARDAFALAQPDVGQRKRPAHRGKVDICRAAVQAERRTAARPAQCNPWNADIPAQAIRPRAQQGRARTTAQVERASAKPEPANIDPIGRHAAASAVERERARRRKKAVQRDHQTLDASARERTRQRRRRRKAQQPASTARETHGRQRKPRPLGAIRLEARQSRHFAVDVAVEVQRSRRQIAATEAPPPRRQYRGFSGAIEIADTAVGAAGKMRAARAHQLGGNQVDARRCPFTRDCEPGAAARIGEHATERQGRLRRQRPDRPFRQGCAGFRRGSVGAMHCRSHGQNESARRISARRYPRFPWPQDLPSRRRNRRRAAAPHRR